MKKLLKNLSALQEKNSAFAPLPTEQMRNLVGGTGEDEGGFETMGSKTLGKSCRTTGSGTTRQCVVSCALFNFC